MKNNNPAKEKVKVIRFNGVKTWPDHILKQQRDLSIMGLSDPYTKELEDEIQRRAKKYFST